MPTPEARARERIDTRLKSAGWVVQDVNAANLGAARGGRAYKGAKVRGRRRQETA